MKHLNHVQEFKFSHAQEILDLLLVEYLFDSLEKIEKRLENTDNENSADKNIAIFTKENSIELGTNLFQISRALEFALKTPERLNSFSKIMTSKLAQIFDAMKSKKIEVINHTGEEYFATMMIKVLDFEIDPNVTKPTITETIEPSIYFNGEMVKIGKIIVTKNQ